MTEELLTKINRLKALAERGVGGEKINAEILLARLLAKHNLNEEDILSDEVKEHEFQFWGLFGKELFTQVVSSVLGYEFSIYQYVHKRNCKTRFVHCTQAQALEIKETFEFYRYYLDEGFKNYYKAFIQVEKIFPEGPDPYEDEREPQQFPEEAYRLMRGIDKHTRYLMIESGEEGIHHS